jgi:hypothetical protein
MYVEKPLGFKRLILNRTEGSRCLVRKRKWIWIRLLTQFRSKVCDKWHLREMQLRACTLLTGWIVISYRFHVPPIARPPRTRFSALADLKVNAWYDMIRYICLLTAIGLTPGDSSTVHIYTQTIHTATQWNRIPKTDSFKYNQQDATLYNILYCCQCCTCFGRFLRPSSGAQKLYTQHRVYVELACCYR